MHLKNVLEFLLDMYYGAPENQSKSTTCVRQWTKASLKSPQKQHNATRLCNAQKTEQKNQKDERLILKKL